MKKKIFLTISCLVVAAFFIAIGCEKPNIPQIDDNGKDTTAIGKDTTAIGKDTTTIGKDTTTIGKDTTTIGKDTTTITLGKDTTIILKMNETFILPNNTMVSFIDVRDGRCPLSMCYKCYFSEAKIKMRIISENVNKEIELNILGCVGVDNYGNEYDYDGPAVLSVDALGYRFKLIRLSPYPKTDWNSINKEDYIAKIKITELWID